MSLIPKSTLLKTDRILFITHLAIGDFTYLHNFFHAFSLAFPHIKIDLWIDEVRRTADPEQWPFLKKYSLYDWTETCPFFNHVYRRTYSPPLFAESIDEARQKNYPVIISLATLRANEYARLARRIGPDAFIVGIKNRTPWFLPWQRFAYARLDACFAPFKATDNYHITDVYADWFLQACGLTLRPQERFPFIHIPSPWQHDAKQQLQNWGANNARIVFINAFAKTKKRCWPLSKVVELISSLQQSAQWKDAHFIVNSVPEKMPETEKIFTAHHLKNTHLFSATDNFFQLPAMLQCCDLIISVETAVMHLANAVHVPVIALMRQKNPEWAPIDAQHSTLLTASRRRDWVDAITVDEVRQTLLAHDISPDTKSANLFLS